MTEHIKETNNVQISDEVIAIVSGIAAGEVEGIAGMAGGVAGGIYELLGKKNLSKGIKVLIDDKNVVIDLSVIVNLGVKIPDVALEVQQKVKAQVETMTGLNVTSVNVRVEGVNFKKEEPKPEEQKKEDGE